MKKLCKLLLLAFVLVSAVALNSQEVATQNSCSPSLPLSALTGFLDNLSTPEGSENSYPIMLKQFYSGSPGDGVTAFEENRFFISAVGTATSCGDEQHDLPDDGLGAKLVRRVIVLRPATFIIDDQAGRPSSSRRKWLVYSHDRIAIKGHTADTISGDRAISWQSVLPQNATYHSEDRTAGGAKASTYILATVAPASSRQNRFLSVFHVYRLGGSGPAGDLEVAEMAHDGGRWNLTVAAGEQVFHLTLPPLTEGSGNIAIDDRSGKVLTPDRPLASGILPHGPEGSRLLDLWDSDYRAAHPPIWDIGHAADELIRVVDSGEVRKCRAIDLCCGSGNDAIYLAGKGFDVTAMDVAPTALGQAEKKAQKAGVSVRWVLADVLAPPALEPFDFIYDRGCYHVVRDQNLSAYLETIRRYSHSGTQLLLLASKRGSNPAEDGSTGVTEEELNFDFLPLFNLEWLREYRLESNRLGAAGPPAWAALMRRKTEP